MATSQTDTAFALDDYGEASFADMPTEVVSCCAGGTVQYTDLARYLRDSLHYAPPSVFQCHAEMVYDVETDPMNARCFFSCAQDGTVNLYDLRVRTSCECNGCNRHTYIDVNATPRSGGGASEVVVGRGSAQSDRRHGRHLDCKSAMGVVPHTTRRAASLPFFLQVKVTPGNLAVTSMAVRHDNPMYMSLGCSDDFVRTYDRRYLARSVHVTAAASGDGTATTTSDAATSLDEERAANLSNELPSSVRSWQGLVHEFCPSHLRRGMHTACKSIRTMSRRRGNENDDDNIVDDEEDSGVNDTDHGMTTDDTNDMYNDFGERTSIRNRRARRLDGDSDAVRTDNRASFERDDYMWHHYAHNITR